MPSCLAQGFATSGRLTDARVSDRGQTSCRLSCVGAGIEQGGQIGFIDLGDAALVIPGGTAVARMELRQALGGRYEGGLASIDDPDLAEQRP